MDKYVIEKLSVVSCNVQKSAKNMTVLLSENQNADLIHVQEPYWGFIKNVVTSVDANGVPYGSMGFTPGAAGWSAPEGIPYEQP